MRFLGGMIVGSAAGRFAARRQFEAMSAAKAQQAQIDQAQAQVSNQGKKNNTIQELERLGSLKQQGLITEEEFQKLKMGLLSSI